MPTIPSTTTTPKKVFAPSLKVDVKTDVINSAKQADSSHCMIAEAIRTTHPNAANISVDIQTIRFSDKTKGLRYTYLTPRIAQLALVRFDQGVQPEPFSFLLRTGQVTQRERRHGGKERSQAQKESLEKARAVSGHTKLQRVDESSTSGRIPTRVGGRTPPVQKVGAEDAIPFSRRRQFGLRALDRKVEVIE